MSEQPSSRIIEGTQFSSEDRVDLHMATKNITSYEELKMKQAAIAAAEKQVTNEFTPQDKIGNIGTFLVAQRADYLARHINLADE